MDSDPVSRRRFVRSTGAAAVGGSALLAGCSSSDEPTDEPAVDDTETGGGNDMADATQVAVGPDGSLVFDPDEVTVSTGDTVEWAFESAGHNVVADPELSDEVSIPDGAEAFASVEGAYDTNDVDETYSYTFDTAGEYVYVCVPHQGQGMIATVVVE